MKSRQARVTVLAERASASGPEIAGARTGTVVSVDAAGVIRVAVQGGKQPHVARLAVPASIARLEAAIASKQPVVLLFEGGDSSRPLILGFVETPAREEPARVVEADVDGQRVRIVGKDEIVLQCGSASVTLRRNGRVLIRGTHVETYSEGTNRIKGGQVRIN
jgi:hypothetical protein